jgi:multicomponent Na+:H+ antiporter subunit B
MPFLTGLWAFMRVGENEIAVSTPMLFDIGVYFTVFGTLSAVALVLQSEDA